MPLVALHQDFVVISALGLADAERNGHHFFPGLSHLTSSEKSTVMNEYPGLYREQDGEIFLNIVNGQVNVSSLHSLHGFGVASQPDWTCMTPLEDWTVG